MLWDLFWVLLSILDDGYHYNDTLWLYCFDSTLPWSGAPLGRGQIWELGLRLITDMFFCLQQKQFARKFLLSCKSQPDLRILTFSCHGPKRKSHYLSRRQSAGLFSCIDGTFQWESLNIFLAAGEPWSSKMYLQDKSDRVCFPPMGLTGAPHCIYATRNRG